MGTWRIPTDVHAELRPSTRVTAGVLGWPGSRECLPWADSRPMTTTGAPPCHMYDASTTLASRSQISMS